MGRFLNPADVPAIDPGDAGRLIADVESQALRRVPSLTTVAPSEDTTAAFRRIVTRWHIEGPAAVTTQSTGPYGVGLAPEKRVGWTLADDELAELRALGGVTAPAPGVPRGDFPTDQVAAIFNPRSSSCT